MERKGEQIESWSEIPQFRESHWGKVAHHAFRWSRRSFGDWKHRTLRGRLSISSPTSCEALWSNHREVMPFWKTLPNQPIVVFRSACFSRPVWNAKIAFVFQQLMHREPEAIVIGDAGDLVFIQDSHVRPHGFCTAFVR